MKTNQKPKKKLLARKTPRPELTAETSLPFVEHLYELRRRIIYVVGSVLVFSTLAYFVQQQIVNFLLRPSHGQQFIYTSPGGGINFLFTVCLYVGVAASIPVIIYQVLGFFEPLIKSHTRYMIIRYSCLSGVLALVGLCFGYFIGLPAALHFLSHQFTTKQIHALFTIQEYMNFLMVYLLGAALLFQVPIILLFTNRAKPLPPRKLLGAERYVIVAAFIIAMIMAPTPDVLSQLIIVLPIVITYNLSILMIWRINRRASQPKHVVELLENDQQVQAGRLQVQREPLPTDPLEVTDRPRRPLYDSPLTSTGSAPTRRPVMDIRLVARQAGSRLSYPQA